MTTSRKVVSALEIAGGSTGFITGLIACVTVPSNLAEVVLVVLTTIPIFSLCLIAGLLLWKNRRSGIFLSLFVQLIQIPIISTEKVLFHFYSGLSFSWHHDTVAFQLGNIFNWKLGPLHYIVGEYGQFIGINLVAVVAFVLLLFVYSRHEAAETSYSSQTI
jgi:hypothetical protein